MDSLIVGRQIRRYMLEMGQSLGRDLTIFHRLDEGAAGFVIVAAIWKATFTCVLGDLRKGLFEFLPRGLPHPELLEAGSVDHESSVGQWHELGSRGGVFPLSGAF